MASRRYLDTKQLEYFVQVAESGSFTKAASLLGVVQPVLSRQVRALEIELRQPLLYRNGRGVSPTEAGRRLLDHGRGILNQLDRAREQVAEIHGAPVGHVIVGLPPSLAQGLTLPLVRAFKQRFPHASIGIVDGLSMYMHEWLGTGRMDIGLLYNPLPSPYVDTVPLVEEDLFLIRRSTDRRFRDMRALALRSLPEYPLIVPGRPHAIRMKLEAELAYLGLKPTVALEIDGVPARLRLVCEGYGYAVLPRTSLLGSGSGMDLVAHPVSRPRLRSKLALGVPSQRAPTPLACLTQELIKEVAGAHYRETNRPASMTGAASLAGGEPGGSGERQDPCHKPSRRGKTLLARGK